MKFIIVIAALFALAKGSDLDLDLIEESGKERFFLAPALNRTYLTVGVGALAGVALFVLFAASTQQAIASKKKFEPESYTDEELSYFLTTYSDQPQLQTRYKRSAPNGNFYYLFLKH